VFEGKFKWKKIDKSKYDFSKKNNNANNILVIHQQARVLKKKSVKVSWVSASRKPISFSSPFDI
jgi:hypothetical protein